MVKNRKFQSKVDYQINVIVKDKMKQILLTGASGFLGKIIYDKLKSNFTITTLGREQVSEDHIFFDLKSQDNLICNQNFDTIVHCAGKAHHIPKNKSEANEFYEINQMGTVNLLNFIDTFEVIPRAFVFISTVSVYGLNLGIDINENYPLNSEEPYGRSKIMAEKIIEEWCSANAVVCTILRLPLVIGNNSVGNLSKMIKGIKRGYYINIDGGKSRKSMVMGEDVAVFIPIVSKIGGTYNLTDGYHPSFIELSSYIANKLGRRNPLNITKKLIYILAKIGDVIGDKSPINTLKLHKITSELIFNDFKARERANWNPSLVLENFNPS